MTNLMAHWVQGWRAHYRPSFYRHIVMDPPKPFWTIVVVGPQEPRLGLLAIRQSIRPLERVEMIEIFDCKQGTPEWHEARRGIPTASAFHSILAKGAGKVRSQVHA